VPLDEHNEGPLDAAVRPTTEGDFEARAEVLTPRLVAVCAYGRDERSAEVALKNSLEDLGYTQGISFRRLPPPAAGARSGEGNRAAVRYPW
jgi:hypothetical protein